MSCLVALCCGLWNSGGGGGLVVCLLSSVCLPLLLIVGVRGSARAALRARTLSPNTIVFPRCLVLSSPLPAFLRAPSFLLLEWRCVIHHVLECCVGMTAMGSLSRSSSFFW